jgi:hypothetical protein
VEPVFANIALTLSWAFFVMSALGVGGYALSAFLHRDQP